MATITLRGKSQYQAEIRRKGHPQQTKTFPTKAQAEAWARAEEARMAAVATVVDSFGGKLEDLGQVVNGQIWLHETPMKEHWHTPAFRIGKTGSTSFQSTLTD